MLKNDITDKRKERHHITQEDFTPDIIVEMMLSKLPQGAFVNFKKKVLDNSCGIGNFLVAVLKRRLEHCDTPQRALKAVQSIYGVELMADNVAECRQRLYDTILTKFPNIINDEKLNHQIRSSIKNRIRWCNSLQFNYEWETIKYNYNISVSFIEPQLTEDTKYPMWYKEDKNVVEPTLFDIIGWN